jgi:hypothetical protein
VLSRKYLIALNQAGPGAEEEFVSHTRLHRLKYEAT